MRYVVLAPFKAEFGDLLNFQVNRLEKSGVTVKLGQAVDATIIDRLKPDVVIVATGARPIRPAIPGLDRLPVKLAEEILAGAPCGKNVVIIGGGAVGYETAEFLLDRGTKTTVIEILD
jgi:pyruvate/2-oxoglutarate dehydrogenase complex dihydrolipoamide dehydrogenase (E3) component